MNALRIAQQCCWFKIPGLPVEDRRVGARLYALYQCSQLNPFS